MESWEIKLEMNRQLKAQGLTMASLCQEIGISRQALSNRLLNKWAWTEEQVDTLNKYFDTIFVSKVHGGNIKPPKTRNRGGQR